ncbi:MAG: precorrin-3B C(17)-methyltransferase [Deltaproteobacteria bacterium]|nr:precorrin-3B C(17)-methyltransferase [Deltaproteobacteria bacterium]
MRTNNDRAGAIYVIGIGPGALEDLTVRAKERLAEAEHVVGYTRYVDLIMPLVKEKQLFTTGMTHEVERCKKALTLAIDGKKVAVVSSGDAGIYGMAGLILQLKSEYPEAVNIPIEVVPGVPAFVSAGALLGAPLMHDFASISLSDLLTPWEKIEARVRAASQADFVIIFYNPKSASRVEGLGKAMRVVSEFRRADTPVGIVRNASRGGEETIITTLGDFTRYYDDIDMLTIVIVGNESSFTTNGRMVTPRGYREVSGA